VHSLSLSSCCWHSPEGSSSIPLPPSPAAELALLIVKLTDITQFKPFALAWVMVGGLQWCLTSWVAYGHTPPPWHEPWLVALESDRTHSCELTQIVRATALDDNEFRYHIIGVEFPWLNANSASFYAAKERLLTSRRCYYTSLGYAETDPRLAYKRFDDLNIDFFISVAASLQPTPPNFVNVVSVPVLLKVQSDPPSTPSPSKARPHHTLQTNPLTNTPYYQTLISLHRPCATRARYLCKLRRYSPALWGQPLLAAAGLLAGS